MKQLHSVRNAGDRHWVGDGFPVHGLFGYSGPGVAERSPFLLLDYAAPTTFGPTTARRGVGAHPHRGFETVTIVFDGSVAHRDSVGHGGTIGPGDVQWMTAGSGLLHEEFHASDYAARGGPFEMVQLWVNLPARDKMTAPRYQAITAADIPERALPEGAGRVRVIAGRYGSGADAAEGPAQTFSPMNVWTLDLDAGARVALPQPEGWTTLLLARSGRVQVNGEGELNALQWATLSQAGSGVVLQAQEPSKLLLLAGAPLNEPVVGHGPFVMTTRQEILQAFEDFSGGRFGAM